MLKQIALYMSLLVLAIGNGSVTLAQGSVEVVQPVTGEMALILNDDDLVWFDTSTGNYRSLVEDENVNSATFDTTGQLIAYQDRLDLDIYYYDLVQDAVNSFEVDSSAADYTPLDWSSNSKNIILVKSTLLTGLSTRFELFSFNIDSEMLMPLNKIFDTFELLPSDFPLPHGVQNAYVMGISFDQNPVFDEWLLFEVRAIDAAFVSQEDLPNIGGEIPDEAVVNQLVLWNKITNSYLPLSSQLFPDEIVTPIAHWHPQGTLLLTYADSDLQIVEFDPTTAATSVVERLANRPYDAVISWLGIDTLLIYIEHDETSGEYLFSIRQIANDTVLETPFIYIPLDWGLSEADFHLSADLPEQYALSCLFDQALPTQMAIGVRGHVSATVPMPLSVHSEPFLLFSTEIGQVEAGEAFSVIDGPACSSGFRLWKVELDNGIMGWVTEADFETYFLRVVD